MKMQKPGLDGSGNEGWRYVKLPQTIYLISPAGENFYFGYADTRFNFLIEPEPRYSFHEICTYSFLGCWEFKKVSDGVWANNKFQIPLAVLDMLINYPEEKRKETFTIWKNLYNRNPKLIHKVSTIRDIKAFTEDGMYLYSASAPADLAREINQQQGIVLFRAQDIPSYEESLDRFDLRPTKALRNALLPVLLKDSKYNPTVLKWCGLIVRIFNQDVLLKLLKEHPELFHYKSRVMLNPQNSELDPYDPDGIKFLKGLGKKFLMELLSESPEDILMLLETFLETKVKFFERFSLDKNSTDKPHFFTHLKRYRVPLQAIPVILSNKKTFEELQATFDFGVPRILLKKGEYTFVVPENLFELLSWGHKLKNCIRNMEHKEFSHDCFIVGVYEKEKLTGACYVNGLYSISSLYRAFNKSFEPEEKEELTTALTKRIRQLNPVFLFAKKNKEKVQRILSNYNESLTENSSTLEADSAALEDLLTECYEKTNWNGLSKAPKARVIEILQYFFSTTKEQRNPSGFEFD